MTSVDITNDKNSTSEVIDTNVNNSNEILIDISDALSEKEKVKFTVHTKVRFYLIDRRE